MSRIPERLQDFGKGYYDKNQEYESQYVEKEVEDGWKELTFEDLRELHEKRDDVLENE